MDEKMKDLDKAVLSTKELILRSIMAIILSMAAIISSAYFLVFIFKSLGGTYSELNAAISSLVLFSLLFLIYLLLMAWLNNLDRVGRQELFKIISKNVGLTIEELSKKANESIANTRYDLEWLEKNDYIRIEKRMSGDNIKRFVYSMEVKK